jgi:hypothetical protein
LLGLDELAPVMQMDVKSNLDAKDKKPMRVAVVAHAEPAGCAVCVEAVKCR